MDCSNHQTQSSLSNHQALEQSTLHSPPPPPPPPPPPLPISRSGQGSSSFSKKKKTQVFLEGYVESSSPPLEDEQDQEGGGGGGGSKCASRTVSLTDEDLDELKGCVDLGFGFNYEEIPELCNTLPALELCYSMNHMSVDSSSAIQNEICSAPSPISNWKISTPGDHPEEVKARLKYWAQAVACTVRLCS